MVLAFRQVSSDAQWTRTERYVRLSFWGLNSGLAMMLAGSLFPGGAMQFYDVLSHGYWHARGLDYLNQEFVKLLEWARLPGDAVFIVLGVVPMVLAAVMTYLNLWKTPVIPIELADK